jgi:hypothetical protein
MIRVAFGARWTAAGRHGLDLMSSTWESSNECGPFTLTSDLSNDLYRFEDGHLGVCSEGRATGHSTNSTTDDDDV